MLRIYYNPKCSKCRAALARLESAGLTPEVLKEPPQRSQLERLVGKLEEPAADLLREQPDHAKTSDAEVITALLSAPETMQRPVIETNDRAIIARPPERLDDFVGIGDAAC